MFFDARKLCALAALLAAGCGHMFVVQTGPVLPPPSSIELVDSRPAISRTTELLSLRARSCEYAIKRFGDDGMTPTPIQLVGDWLARREGAPTTAHRVEIKDLDIHWNLQRRVRMQNASIMLVNACEPDASRPGGVAEEERAGNSDVVIVRVSLEVDGVPCAGRAVLVADEDPETHDELLLAALDAALTQAFASAAATDPLAPSTGSGVVELAP